MHQGDAGRSWQMEMHAAIMLGTQIGLTFLTKAKAKGDGSVLSFFIFIGNTEQAKAVPPCSRTAPMR
jgi:hypothetical protein